MLISSGDLSSSTRKPKYTIDCLDQTDGIRLPIGNSSQDHLQIAME